MLVRACCWGIPALLIVPRSVSWPVAGTLGLGKCGVLPQGRVLLGHVHLHAQAPELRPTDRLILVRVYRIGEDSSGLTGTTFDSCSFLRYVHSLSTSELLYLML